MLKSALCPVLMVMSTLSQAQPFKWETYQGSSQFVIMEQTAQGLVRPKPSGYVSTPIDCEVETRTGLVRGSQIRSSLRTTGPSCTLVCPEPGVADSRCRVVIESLPESGLPATLVVPEQRPRGAFQPPTMSPPPSLLGR